MDVPRDSENPAFEKAAQGVKRLANRGWNRSLGKL